MISTIVNYPITPKERGKNMFKKINDGNVALTAEKNKVYGGPRVALLPDGTLACTYTVSSYVGANDFILHIA